MDKKYMLIALEEAKKAFDEDEVPVGAVIVKDNKVIARAHNKREQLQSATAHAEVLAIEKACQKIGYWRLNDCDIYITMEPCMMCSGAIINARIANVYYGAYDTRVHCISGEINLLEALNTNHHPSVCGGILEKECSELLSSYFKNKRKG